MKKTKIVCTLGPACEDDTVLEKIILSGADVLRMNFSHGNHAYHKENADRVKALRKKLGLYTPLLLDTKGPEVRIKHFKNPPAILEKGQEFKLFLYDTEGDEHGVSVTHTRLNEDVSVDDRILIDDGLIEMRVESADCREIVCTVINGGILYGGKGVNVPGVHLSLDFLSERDKADIEFAVREDIDFIAASFTQCADDVIGIRHYLESLGSEDVHIIAKIESAAGVANIDKILEVSDGVMVARGDLGVEIPLEEIPVIQKSIISKAYSVGKPVITATQMLESMTHNPRPTRAEICDVANAIYDGSSAIMLSGETAIGEYPVEAVRTMSKIARRTENDIDYISRFAQISERGSDITGAVSHAACQAAVDLGASAIIAVSESGYTPRMLSRFRPDTGIIGCSPSSKSCRQLMLSWGVTPLKTDEVDSTDKLFENAAEKALASRLVNPGELAVVVAGTPLKTSGTTNMLKAITLGDTGSPIA